MLFKDPAARPPTPSFIWLLQRLRKREKGLFLLPALTLGELTVVGHGMILRLSVSPSRRGLRASAQTSASWHISAWLSKLLPCACHLSKLYPCVLKTAPCRRHFFIPSFQMRTPRLRLNGSAVFTPRRWHSSDLTLASGCKARFSPVPPASQAAWCSCAEASAPCRGCQAPAAATSPVLRPLEAPPTRTPLRRIAQLWLAWLRG